MILSKGRNCCTALGSGSEGCAGVTDGFKEPGEVEVYSVGKRNENL